MRLIIIEGIDRVGKTTLIHHIKKHTKNKCVVFKDSYITNANIDETTASEKIKSTLNTLIAMEQADLDITVVMDRFHLTELVYGYLDRGYLNIYVNNVDHYIANNFKDVTLVVVQPTDINKSSKEHGKSLDAHDAMFKALINSTNIKNIEVCNYHSMERLAKALIEKPKANKKVRLGEVK